MKDFRYFRHLRPQAKNGRRRGVLTFEWILLMTVLVLGIVGGLSAVRDATIDELGDVAAAALSLDMSYEVAEFSKEIDLSDGSKFTLNLPGMGYADQSMLNGNDDIDRKRQSPKEEILVNGVAINHATSGDDGQ